MKHIPFCRDCAFYGGRKNGMGKCNYGEKPFLGEHIKSDFWCIKGTQKWEIKDEKHMRNL